PALAKLLEKDRTLFEHWTHDASIIPTAFFPHWRLRFARDGAQMTERWRNWHGEGFDSQFARVLAHIRDNGVASTSDVGQDEERKSGGWWEWNPSKTALEFLWRTGEIAVCHRQNFRKHYDLTERVIPPDIHSLLPSAQETINWAANAALDRLGFAKSGDIAKFWAKLTPAEAKDWTARALKSGEIEEIDVQSTDGTLRKAFARPGTIAHAQDLPDAPKMIRVLSPFDPMIRNRDRCERLFDFFYRIEVFVPAPKRQYGYYVFPLLEGDTLIGRIDMKTRDDALHVAALWSEPKVQFGKARMARLEAALDRTARLAGVSAVSFANDWRKGT
ncbi:MAG: crosslink repair DNA glycosylase YcaQ family protein, partial [Deltaproteobacteria bacterium]